MRFNRQMHGHLLDLKSREIGLALDPTFAARAPLDVAEHAGGVVLLKQPARGWRSRLAVFHDPTNLECTANKISVGDLLDPRWARSAPLLLLTAGLVLTERLSRELTAFPGRFNIILSYDGDSCAVRFHRIRPGEAWLHEDLEEYSEEGVLVCEAGEAPQIGLLGS
jgi:hypothetical protein